LLEAIAARVEILIKSSASSGLTLGLFRAGGFISSSIFAEVLEEAAQKQPMTASGSILVRITIPETSVRWFTSY
jgi:hypothetical protein